MTFGITDLIRLALRQPISAAVPVYCLYHSKISLVTEALCAYSFWRYRSKRLFSLSRNQQEYSGIWRYCLRKSFKI